MGQLVFRDEQERENLKEEVFSLFVEWVENFKAEDFMEDDEHSMSDHFYETEGDEMCDIMCLLDKIGEATEYQPDEDEIEERNDYLGLNEEDDEDEE